MDTLVFSIRFYLNKAVGTQGTDSFVLNDDQLSRACGLSSFGSSLSIPMI
jgi:hypothetical protein